MKDRFSGIGLSFLIALLLTLSSVQYSKAMTEENAGITKKTRMMINLLDYIGRDYSEAVENGKIINEFEYKEMKEFCEKAEEQFILIAKKTGKFDTVRVKARFDSLSNAIRNKDDMQKINEFVTNISRKVYRSNLISLSPKKWPDLIKGK
ncbi:MAG: hypothetical protein ABEH43_04805, partial [Flavobacteriales bacterium]